MKRNIAGLILSGLMVVLLTTCGEKYEVPPKTITLGGVTYTVIAEESDFGKMRSDLTGNYYLWRDVALTEDFEPIGDDSGPFTGIFEGNNQTISNLRISESVNNFVGLFGQIGDTDAFDPANPEANGVVRNLTLVLTAGTMNAPSVEGAHEVGALAGKSYGKIEAVGAEGGLVKGADYIGGLVGQAHGDITSSYATVSVRGDSSVGGLVGWAQSGSTITSSYATVSVEGTGSNVGGLVGLANGDITSSYATVSVTGANLAGGLVGRAWGTITSSYFDTSRTSQTSGIGQDENNQSRNVEGITESGITNGGSQPFAGAGWNFTTPVWAAQDNGQWPLLAWQ